MFPVGLLRWGRTLHQKKKKNIVLRPPPQTRHDPPTQQTSSPHSLWVYMCVCVQAQSAGWGYSKCMLSSPTDSHDELRAKKSVWLCLRVCVCVLLWIEIAASAGREHSRMGVLLRDQGGGEGKWEREESGFSGLSGRRVWESRVIRMWVMRKWRRQITPCDINNPTPHWKYISPTGRWVSLHQGWKNVYNIMFDNNYWCLTLLM